MITWGGGSGPGWASDPGNMGEDSSAVATSLTSGVTNIFANGSAFAALKDDGSVITWGSPYGGADSSNVAASLASGVSTIFSSAGAFAALKEDGSVVTWGFGSDSSAVSASLTSDVSQIFSTGDAFAALKEDGSVVIGIGFKRERAV